MRRWIALLLAGGVAGYWVGYRDAQRGPASAGARIAHLLHQVHPDSIRAQRQQQAEVIRQRIHQQSAGAIEP